MSNKDQRKPLRISLSSRNSRPEKRQRTLDISSHLPVALQHPRRSNHNVHDIRSKPNSCASTEDFNFSENHISESSLPNDVIMAIRSLACKQSVAYCPLSSSTLLPFILKPMLHQAFLCKPTAPTTDFLQVESYMIDHESQFQNCLTNANTGVNIELLDSCQKNTVRLLALLGTGGCDDTTVNREDDIAIMETQHYVEGILDAFHRSSWLSKQRTTTNDRDYEVVRDSSSYCNRKASYWTDDQCSQVIQWYIAELKSWTGTYVKHVDIDRAAKKTNDRNQPTTVFALPTGSTTQMIVDYLLSIGVLLPRKIPNVIATDSFWFTLPLLGTVSKALTTGRKQMMTQFKRSYYKEMKMSTILTKAFGDKNYNFPANFLVRDLVSRGIVKILETPSGEFVRLIQTK